MLNLTKKVDYGLIALTHLALEPGVVASSREMAERYNISPALLSNIMKRLSHHGFVESVRGVKGGYALKTDPALVRMAEVVRVLEGDLKLTECTGHHGPEGVTCEQHDCCLVKRTIGQLHARLQKVLDGITIRDLADDARALLAEQSDGGKLLAITKAHG